MAAALKRVSELIKVEHMKDRNVIPIVFVCSDCGANISVKYPDLIAQVETDYVLIARESKQKIHMVVLEPKKSYATQNLGVHSYSAEKIKKNFKKYAGAQVYKFSKYNPNSLILELKKIL